MNYVKVLPISEYQEALHHRLPEEHLSIGVLYNVIFTLRQQKTRAIRFNALLSRLPASGPKPDLELNPVDADLRPLGLTIDAAINDGIVQVSRSNPIGLAYIDRRTGQHETAMLHNGLLTAYRDDLDLSPLMVPATREDLLVVG